MKLKILFMLVVTCSVIFSGCVTETGSPEQNTGDASEEDINDSGQNSDSVTAGWYLKEIIDFGDDPENTDDYYTYDVIYARGNITTIRYGGSEYELRVTTTWTTPPEYIEEEGEISIDIKKEGLVVAIGGLFLDDKTSVNIDKAYYDLGVSSGVASKLSNETYGTSFRVGQGDVTGVVKEGTFTGTAPKADAFDGEFGLSFQFQNGKMYGTDYIYEWRE